VILCITQTVSWGLLYYSLPTAAAPISAATGWSQSAVTAAFSAGLLLSAVAGIAAGRLLDRHGPGFTMPIGSVLGVVGLAAVGSAPNLALFVSAWLVVGAAQSLVLYPAAFAAITQWYQERRVRPLTVVTVSGGLASTIFAPTVAYLVTQLGWRETYLVLAAGFGVITLPLHLVLRRLPWKHADGRRVEIDHAHVRSVTRSARFRLLQAALAVTMLAVFAVTVNLVPLLTSRGAGYGLAAFGLGLLGAGQVAGRISYAVVPQRQPPAVRLVIIGLAAAVSLAGLAVIPGPVWLLISVGVLAGALRGCQTLLQATAVSDRWGTRDFGTINGIFGVPLVASTALAPAVGAGLGGLIGFPLMTGLMAVLAAVAALACWRT
jgi:predicted MFS family arabinose efflux permease